ncbi:MAG: hypothetical protein L0219_13570 [Phycisphaerales bacterium]|nr:hypothetical protein [Phycisphaerales bacterium]MCI0676570.1 hypothetical protein [Phycisphaerales bacterium]
MRKLFRLVAVLVVLLIVAAVALVVWVDRIAKVAVERGSTYALGVPARLDSADVRILGGEFAMSGFTVSNPEGFKTDHFMTLQQGDVALATSSLMADTIELPTLTLSGIDMNLEKKDGAANYKVILQNLKRFESKETKPAEDGKKFVVRKLLIKDVNVHVDLMGGGDLTKVNVPVDVIELHDVGSGGKPVRISDLMGVILKAVFAAVLDKGGQLIPADINSELGKALGELSSLAEVAQIGELADFGVKTVGEVGDAAKGIGDKTKETLDKTIGDLFGDKKKNP